MKTKPMSPMLAPRDNLLLVEEVLVTVPSSKNPRRVLLGHALVFAANALNARVPFEIRRLNQDVIANFDGEKLVAHVEVDIVLKPVSGFLNQFVEQLAKQQISPSQKSTASSTST